MNSLQGKHFSITDTIDVNTIIYQINETEKSLQKDSPKYTLERLEYTQEFVGDKKKKTFFIDEPKEDGNELVIFSFGKEKVVINTGVLEEDIVKIAKGPSSIKYNSIYNEVETEYKDFKYTPNLKRPICIIDPDTGEEVKPILYFDDKANEVKGKCKLKPYKSYFAFEIGEGNGKDQ